MNRRLNRRQALAGFGTVSLGAVLAACGGSSNDAPPADDTSEFDAAARCEQTAELTEGPYYFDADAIRSDIREDRPGAPLRLGIRVRSAGSCEPIKDAVVDIWHCDAGGVYSGFEAGEGERFLRGTQITNADGVAEFTTVYPGWYQGRTVHIHAKVHLDRKTVLTTQLFFDDAFTDQLYASTAPYSSQGERDVRNEDDNIFSGGGDRTTLAVGTSGSGYTASMVLAVSQ